MPPDPDPAPLILTLLLDDASQRWFDGLRRRYFPAGRTQVGAHVTMFHALPGVRERAVLREVAGACRLSGPMRVAVSGLRFLGRGVAFGLHAPAAEAVGWLLLARTAALGFGYLPARTADAPVPSGGA